MKRFEMILVVLAMWLGAAIGENIGLVVAVATYVIFAEALSYLNKIGYWKKLLKRDRS
jgi:hypothetical protein